MITDFLKTSRTKEELKVALNVLQEFKSYESLKEYMLIQFEAWAKLEQLEEFLEHLVYNAPLAKDTLHYIETGSGNEK